MLRPHRIGVARYTPDGPAERIEVDLDPAADGGRTALPGLTGRVAEGLLLPNDGDLTFAKIRLDPASADAVGTVLPGLADPLARALLWEESLDAATDGERPVSAVVSLLTVALPTETEVAVAERRARPQPQPGRPLPRPARPGCRAAADRPRPAPRCSPPPRPAVRCNWPRPVA